MYGYIYKTTNMVNKKVYIGKKKSNKFICDYFGSGVLIQRALNKYGINNFKLEIIDQADTLDELNEKEKFWIKEYNSQDLSIGYNIASGGDGGDIITQLPKDKYNAFIEDCKRRAKGKNNPNFNNGDKIAGDKNPAKRTEVRKKISNKVSGKGNGMYGKKQTKESLNKKYQTTISKYGFIPNRYSVNKSNWRYFIYLDDNNNTIKQLYRTKTELIREIKKLGFSPKVIENIFNSSMKECIISHFEYPKQSKVKHKQALEKYKNAKIIKYEDNTEIT